MSGRFFNPFKQKEASIGFLSIPNMWIEFSRLRNRNGQNDQVLETYLKRYQSQLQGVIKQKGFSGPLQLIGSPLNIYFGHTALFCAVDGKLEAVTGWVPDVPAEILLKNPNNKEFEVCEGIWADDTGMEFDLEAVFWGTPVTSTEYEQFSNFLKNLIGKKNFGEVKEDNQVKYFYAFQPANKMNEKSVLEQPKEQQRKLILTRNPLIRDTDLSVIANCSDATFHVISNFLLEWKKTELADELRNHVVTNPNLGHSFLINWLKKS
jgi:hypothetical protein